jgi:hypothetical protein
MSSMINAAHPGREGTVGWTIVHLSSVPDQAAATGNHFSSPACLARPNLSLTLREHESVDPVHWHFMSALPDIQACLNRPLAQNGGAQQATDEERRRESDRTAKHDPNRGP